LIRISSELRLIGNRREERGKSEARSRKSEVGKDEKIRRSPRLNTLEGNPVQLGRPRLNTPMYHLPELQGRLEGNPREMRSAVVNEFHRVNPVQLGGRGRLGKRTREEGRARR
jgi:hypothetical protein